MQKIACHVSHVKKTTHLFHLDVNSVNVTKSEVKRAIFEHHYRDMVEIVDKQTKLESIKGEDFREIPQYFEEKSVENSRMVFRVTWFRTSQEILRTDTG